MVRTLFLGLATYSLSLSAFSQPLLYINGLIESVATAAGEAASGVGPVGSYTSGGVSSTVTQPLVSALTELGYGHYSWATASAVAMGRGTWPSSDDRYWQGRGAYLARTDGIRNLLFTGEVPRVDLAYLEQAVQGQDNGYSSAEYLHGVRGTLHATGSHYASFLIYIPFRVSRSVPAVLAIAQNVNYSIATSGYPSVTLEEIPPITDVKIERWNPIRAEWEEMSRLRCVARPDGFPSPGRYLDSRHSRMTVSLEAGVQYRLVIWVAGKADFTGVVGYSNSINSAFGGGIGSSVLLIANRSTVPLSFADIRADIDANGVVDDGDLLAILNSLGNTGVSLPEDVNVDEIVDDGDLMEVLVRFGMSY